MSTLTAEPGVTGVGTLAAALAYAARGWPVFPCRPRGKAPAIPSAHPEGDPLRATCHGECGRDGHGFKDATTDEARIRAWWAARPGYNIGIATGAPGPDVLDVDTDDETGIAALGDLRKAGLLDGHGPIVRTRSGGWHVYFTGTAQTCGTLRPSFPIDFKATGGYVIAPPSWVEADDRGPAGHYTEITR